MIIYHRLRANLVEGRKKAAEKKFVGERAVLKQAKCFDRDEQV